MLMTRLANDRGYADHGWLKTFHSFSFADYYDPEHMGFGNLRVINEDKVEAGCGFGTHSHRNMEIISYVLSGALAHRDSMNNEARIPAGDVQYMSAGKGVTHSEFNLDQEGQTHFLQIWIEPDVRYLNAEPRYAQMQIKSTEKEGKLRLIAAPETEPQAGVFAIRADARVYAGIFDANAEKVTMNLAIGRCFYVHLIRGKMTVNGVLLSTGDALKIADQKELNIAAQEASELLVFDLAAPNKG